MNIVADNLIPYIDKVLLPFGELTTMRGEGIDRHDISSADALLVRTRTRCDKELLEGSSVKFIGTATIGYDHIDTDYCAAHNIKVVTAAGCNARAVLQWVGAALVWLARHDRFEPSQRTLGVVGVGHVGSLVVEYARKWGFEVLCSDPPRELAEHLGRKEGFVPLDELVSRSDIVSFHPLLTRTGDFRTCGMVNQHILSLFKADAVLMNASRGEVIDHAALRHAVDNGLRCCLDVWNGEPHDIDRHIIESTLLATPHIAGYSKQGKANASAIIVRALAQFAGHDVGLWYPSEVEPCEPKAIDWPTLCATIDDYFDICQESTLLKACPERLESRRNSYPLRNEYF